MYHLAEIVRDAKRDMDERSSGAAFSTWAAYTPLPFLYALSGQISKTMQRKAPDLVKRAAVLTRDQIADTLSATQHTVHEWRVVTTRRGQVLFHTVKSSVETVPLPGPVEPIRSHVAVPVLNGVEGLVQFVTSEELPELYFVAKTSMTRHVVLRHLVVPPLTAMEKVVRYMVILPTQVVFPSREEVESRTDLFLDVSTSRMQSLVEYIYSATEVLDQHWSMVQWNILGRGPYESLSMERRHDVVRSILQRMRIIESQYKLYEFMASIRLQNEMLYVDVLKEFPETTGVPLTRDQVEGNAQLLKDLHTHDQEAFPCWFYRKIEFDLDTTPLSPRSNASVNTTSSQTPTAAGANNNKVKWVEFPPHENRRLERFYRNYERQRKLHGGPLPPPIVVVDEGRHEVNLDTMEMMPVYWTPVEKIEVCRSTWLYAQRNYGLAPYNPSAAQVLEQAFTYYLAHHDTEKARLRETVAKRSRRSSKVVPPCTLNIPVEGHLVEIKGPHDMMQYKRLLAGTTPFTSKRRVYRGDPRIRADLKTIELWKRAVAVENAHGPTDDDADVEEEIDHLVLIVHGIGDALKTIDIINVVTLRSIIDCAASLRCLHKEALRSTHFEKLGGDHPRTEFLPIEWHSKLHIDRLDSAIRDVTLPAIPKLREFANDTILDVLFFMSPMFHRVILEHVATEMNRVFTLFQSRNRGWRNANRPHSRKKVSIIAHSLGAIISFDVLNHQPPAQRPVKVPFPGEPIIESSDEDDDDEEDNGEHDEVENGALVNGDDAMGFEALLIHEMQERSRSDSECLRLVKEAKQFKIPLQTPLKTNSSKASNGIVVQHPKRATSSTKQQASASTHRRHRKGKSLNGSSSRKSAHRRRKRSKTKEAEPSTSAQPSNQHDVPVLAFTVENLFCFGSPVGLFLNVRGQKITKDFRLPTCKRVFNIYHPYDPVAYRIEPILNPRRANSKAAIIRTFEGKLRFQYQLRNSFRRMWTKLRQWRRNFETQVENAVLSVGLVEAVSPALGYSTASSTAPSTPHAHRMLDTIAGESEGGMLSRLVSATEREDEDNAGRQEVFGKLCQGLPIDYSLQENEIEITNEYLFALTSHVIYWGNRDASLFVAQKMILEPPMADSASDSEDDEEALGVVTHGSISPAFSAFSMATTTLHDDEEDDEDSAEADCRPPPALF